MHLMKSLRYAAFGAVTEVVEKKAQKTGVTISSNWKLSLSITTVIEGTEYPVAGVDSRGQLLWQESTLQKLGWSREELVLRMRK